MSTTAVLSMRRLYSLAARGGCNDEVVLRIRPGLAYADPALPIRPLRAGYRPKKPGRLRKRNDDRVDVERLRSHEII